MRYSLCVITIVSGFVLFASGCWQQQRAQNQVADLIWLQNVPLDTAYPGTRELMNAPSNDPALNPTLSGDLVRP
jgi:hypothetical protein